MIAPIPSYKPDFYQALFESLKIDNPWYIDILNSGGFIGIIALLGVFLGHYLQVHSAREKQKTANFNDGEKLNIILEKINSVLKTFHKKKGHNRLLYMEYYSALVVSKIKIENIINSDFKNDYIKDFIIPSIKVLYFGVDSFVEEYAQPDKSFSDTLFILKQNNFANNYLMLISQLENIQLSDRKQRKIYQENLAFLKSLDAITYTFKKEGLSTFQKAKIRQDEIVLKSIIDVHFSDYVQDSFI